VGFLNPWIYSTASNAFTDITNGSSIGCNTTGFPAAKGWDAVSGFGTPVSLVMITLGELGGNLANSINQYFPKLKDVALSGSDRYEAPLLLDEDNSTNDILTVYRATQLCTLLFLRLPWHLYYSSRK
jgi:tripeptidyl-peptidase-1